MYQHTDWGNEPTVSLPAYRTLANGPCGPLIHITPFGTHYCPLDCDGICLTCGQPLEANNGAHPTID